MIDWQIPPAMLRWVREVPRDRPVAVLLRHSVRPSPLPDDGFAVPITGDGVRIARDLGGMLASNLRSLHASPLVRCVQTAEALQAGASVDLAIEQDRLLGDSGVYVVDNRVAWPSWQQLGHEGVMAHLVSKDEPLPGMASPAPAARFLVHHMLSAAAARPGFHLFVTHDSLVTATAARMLGEPLGKADWPWYLEGAFFWSEGREICVAYRDSRRACWKGPLCAFDKADVIEFARREVGRTVGLASRARFFLAGGAFKTLLTGRPPRDLDLWAPSETDRQMLVATLLERGARPLDKQPYSDAFEIRGRIVEVPHKAEPSTLAERIARFDIGLSCVGVEHRPGDQWDAITHPLAPESVDRREVLLIKPLVNWRHSLATLERSRQYAVELGYAVPEEEVAEVWRVFESQTAEMQAGMIERFDRTSRGGFGVREEAVRRRR